MNSIKSIREFAWGSLVSEPKEVVYTLLDRSGTGAVKIVNPQASQSLNLVELKNALSGWIHSIGDPILVYRRNGLWKHIGVSLEVELDRAGGVGDIPLHIDLVNASFPPDLVVFLCEKGAGAYGGESVIAPFRSAFQLLSSKVIKDLESVLVREGRFFDLENVGVEKNPFPLLETDGSRVEWVRYTGKSKLEVVQGSADAVKSLGEAMRKVEVEFELSEGEAFIVNQRLAAHGRRRLSLDQEALPEIMQRSVWQLFIRGRDHDMSRCFVYPA